MSPVRLLLALVALLVLMAGCSTAGGGATPTTPPGATPAAATQAPRFEAEAPSDWSGGTIELADLPPEAVETLALIAEDGPYPYRQDDGVFQNREGILPDRPMGTYREYTVETPGSPDRGARRLVVGDGRDVYYTDDHYDSFRFVIP